MAVDRQTVDLSAYPDLVVFYLGMRVRRPRGMLRLLGLGPQIQKSWKAQPDGLLLHEDFIWSLIPPHAGMRQYWRDLDSLERWSHSEPHKLWWQQYLRDSGGTGLWHETYFMGGGIEAIYDDMNRPTGLARFAPARPARGAMFSARRRAGRSEPSTVEPELACIRGHRKRHTARAPRRGHRRPRPALRRGRPRRLRRQRGRPGRPRRRQTDPGRQQVGALPRRCCAGCWPGPAGAA